MNKVFFLVNSMEDYFFKSKLKQYLSSMKVTVGESFPKSINEYDLVILWSYRKVIPNLGQYRNIIVFHSSNLPEGKGWAPIYYAIKEMDTHFTITGFIASDKVDEGDIIVKARFAILPSYTAHFLRQWDHEISLLLVQKILARFKGRTIKGISQSSEGTYRPRRQSDENEINVKTPFVELIPHLRACEKQHPAFFHYEGVKYQVTVEPDPKPEFPKDLEIVFYDSS